MPLPSASLRRGGTRGRRSSLGKMIARGVRRGDYASRQRRGRAGNWKPRYPLNRERPRIFRVIRQPIAPPFSNRFYARDAISRLHRRCAHGLLVNVVSRHARFDALTLSLSLSISFSSSSNKPRFCIRFFLRFENFRKNVRKSGILDKSVQRYRNKFPESWPPPRSLPVKPDSDSEPVSSHCYAKAGLRVRGEGRSKGRERVQKGRRRCKARCKATVKRYTLLWSRYTPRSTNVSARLCCCR